MGLFGELSEIICGKLIAQCQTFKGSTNYSHHHYYYAVNGEVMLLSVINGLPLISKFNL